MLIQFNILSFSLNFKTQQLFQLKRNTLYLIVARVTGLSRNLPVLYIVAYFRSTYPHRSISSLFYSLPLAGIKLRDGSSAIRSKFARTVIKTRGGARIWRPSESNYREFFRSFLLVFYSYIKIFTATCADHCDIFDSVYIYISFGIALTSKIR